MQPEERNTAQQPPKENEITETYTPKPAIEDSAQAPDAESATQTIDDSSKISATNEEPVHWQAAEYIHGEKNIIWYGLFVIVVFGFIAVDIFLMKSYTFSVLVVVMAVAIIVYLRRPPRTVDYTLSGEQGLYIGERLYHFSEFKAFGLIKDDGQHSIMLIPIKRFSPGVSVYFPESDGEKIIDILGARLPMENLKLDMVDVVVKKLRL
jgi:hypothetical protein